MTQLIVELRDGAAFDFTLPKPIEVMVDQGRGPQGPPGPAGQDGSDGADGTNGTDGGTGPQGPPGNDGPQGPPGDDGADGADGAPGADGIDGQDGADGATGPKGDTGDTGPTGPAGPKGDTGETGDAGADGADGVPGSDGADGATGPKGDTGDVGPKGDTGDQGPKGDTGDTGPEGPKGDTGDPGADGADGSDGATGADGADGANALGALLDFTEANLLGGDDLHPNDAGMDYLANQYERALADANRLPEPGETLYAYGDSWTHDDINNTSGRRAVVQLCDDLGLTLSNGAFGGYRAEDVATAAIYTAAIPAATTDIALVAGAGLNDLIETDSATRRNSSRNGIRAAIVACSAEERVEHGAMTVDTGSFSVGTGTTASGGSNWYTTAHGSQASYTVGTAGHWYFMILAAVSGMGAWTFKVNGVTKEVVNTNNQHVDTGHLANAGYGPMAIDLGNLEIGDVVTATFDNLGTSGNLGYLDCLMRIPEDARTVLAQMPVRVDAADHINDDLLSFIRAQYTIVAAEIGRSVVLCDPASTLFPNPGTPGPQGDPGVDGTDGADGAPGADGADGSGSGVVMTIVPGTDIDVDDTDPANPVVSYTGAGGGGGSSIKDARWTALSGQDSYDEFNDSDLDSNWIRVDASGTAGYVSWTEDADVLVAEHTTSSDGSGTLHAMMLPLTDAGGSIATGDAFVTAMTIFPYNAFASGQFTMGGLIISDGVTHGSGKQLCALSFDDGNGQSFDLWSFTGFNSSGTEVTPKLYSPYCLPWFHRIVYLGSSQWRVDLSPDGVRWAKAVSLLTQSSFTPTHVGFLISNWSSGQAGSVAYDCIRRESGVS